MRFKDLLKINRTLYKPLYFSMKCAIILFKFLCISYFLTVSAVTDNTVETRNRYDSEL